MTYLYFTVVKTRVLSPCALFPISSLSWIHICCVSFLSLCSDTNFSLGPFWAPGANVPRDTRTSFCSHRTIFSFFSHLPFRSFSASQANFPWDSYSILQTPLSDAALLSFVAISARSTGSSWYSWGAISSGSSRYSWYSRRWIWLVK